MSVSNPTVRTPRHRRLFALIPVRVPAVCSSSPDAAQRSGPTSVSGPVVQVILPGSSISLLEVPCDG